MLEYFMSESSPSSSGAKSPTLTDLIAVAAKFRDDRDWKQFHSPKDLAANLCIEAAELLELTQWRTGEALIDHLKSPPMREAFEDEMADVLLTLLLLAHDQEIDLASAFARKMKKNEAKYPVEKSKGRSEKYDRL
jgi:NTP pyrophosphatase (non-canonical NTP hydrolase)